MIIIIIDWGSPPLVSWQLVISSSSCYPIKPQHQRHRPSAPLERKEEGALLHYVCNYYAHPKLAQDTQQYSWQLGNLSSEMIIG
jgi:hypothetical protein